MIRSLIFNKILSGIFFINFASNVSASEITEDFLALAKVYFVQGQYYLAEKEAENALGLATTETQKALANGFKGNLLLQLQRYDEAKESLLTAFRKTEDSQLKAGYANSLGVIYHKTSNLEKAADYFREALNSVEKDSVLALQIELNQLRAQPEKVDISVVNELLEKISLVDSLEERIRYYLNLAFIAKPDIARPDNQNNQKEAYLQMQGSLEVSYSSNNQGDNALYIELLDSLAELYEMKGKEQEALSLSEHASILAKDKNIKDIEDLLINIEWRKGRIYQHQGRDQDALAAFGLAVDYIQMIRRDIPITYEDGKSSFKEKLGPIYLAYVRQLLIKAGHQEGGDKKRTLSLARQTIEQIKQTELEDYLGGRCMFDGIEYFKLDNMDEETAVLYPIILPNRLELLVGIGQAIEHYTSDVSADQVKAAAQDLSRILRIRPSKRGEHDYKLVSKDLYKWLIKPIEGELEKKSIKTLVIVPDGVLRLVPFSALFDGEREHFLVEKTYALSISPGMRLLRNSVNARNPREYQMLFAGVEIPARLIEKEQEDKVKKLFEGTLDKGCNQEKNLSEQSFISCKKNLSEQLLKSSEEEIIKRADKEKIKSKLPYVKTESDNIRTNKRLSIESLLDENFTAENFIQKLKEKSYDIIHVASHGYLSSETDGYLLAYDEKIKLDELRKFVKRNKDTQKGIQLLTFSACRTAEGDDRIPLGFAGAALKAEALSALGSLWPVSDKATAKLMEIFYEQLVFYHDKAKSLKEAQLQLLKDPIMQDPFFWSAFILVGSWL